MTGKRKATGQNDPTVPLAIRITPSQRDWLKEVAARENRTVSQQVRHLIDLATQAKT
jgi:uncharacterized protein (DUF1778 family)